MYVVEGGKSWYINLFIIIVAMIAVAAYLLIYKFSNTEKSLTVNGLPTVAGARMPCGQTTDCSAGLVCTNTSLGTMCLAPPGGPCNSLYECNNQSTICNGRCVFQTGDVGDYCTETSDCNGILVCAGEIGSKRCLLPQGATTCINFYDCVPGSTCNQGLCEAGIPPYSACTDSYQCSGSNNCLSGRCEPIDITVAGSPGSYCNITAPACLQGLDCQESPDYNLPPNIGYCTRPQSQINSVCNRFTGCIKIGECLNGKCALPLDINSCFNEKCSGGYTCANQEKCVGLTAAPCNLNVQCSSGTCGSFGLNSLIAGGNNSIYAWNQLHGQNQIPTTISMYESIENNIVQQNIAIWNISEQGNLTIFQPGNTISSSFSFETPSGYNILSVENIKIYQGGNVVFQLAISNGSINYSKLVLRNYLTLNNLTTVVNLSTPEAQQYPNNIETISFYNYDYIGNYFYFISGQTGLYYVNAGNLQLGQLDQSTFTNVIFITHYTTSFTTSEIYNPSQVLILSYLDPGPSNPGWYLHTLDLTFAILISADRNFNPQIALSFSVSNIISNFQFFYYNSEGYYWAIISPTGIQQNQVAGYVGTSINILQSLANPNMMITATKTCT